MELLLISFIALLITVVLLLAFPAFTSINNKKKQHRKHPPTPPALPIIGHLHLLKPPRHLSIINLSSQYGPLVFLRLGLSRTLLIVSSPSVLEEIFTINDRVFSNHPQMHAGKFLLYDNISMFSSPYGDHWRNLRRITASDLLSIGQIAQLASLRKDELMLHVCDMGNKGEVKLMEKMFDLSYGVMLRMVTGRMYYGEEAEDEDIEIAKEIKEIFEEGMEILYGFNPRDFFPALGWFDFMGVERRTKKLMEKRDDTVGKVLEECKKKRKEGREDQENKSIVELMLSFQATATDGGWLTDEVIQSQIYILVMAGTESVSANTYAAMALLLCYPQVLNKARAEIDAIIEPTKRLINESDLPKLPYLNCIVKEMLRLIPNLVGFPPRESSEDCTIQGCHVPKGTILMVNLWTLHRDPKLWDNPMEFKPERFMGHNGWKDGFRFIPFGAGRRSCPGENLSVRFVTYIVGLLIQCFDWIPMTREEVDLDGLLGLATPKKQPVVAKYKIREVMAEAILNN